MFESAEIGHRVSKAEYSERVPALRESLLQAQYALLEKANVAVLVVVAGVDGAGKGDTIKQLNNWLDPRLIRTHGFAAPSDEERERPPLWRYFRALPPRGHVGVFMGSWYTDPILSRVYGKTKDVDLDSAMDRARHFENMLTDEGVIVLKLWFHLSKEEQRARLESLARKKRTRWRVTEQDWKHFRMYDRFRAVSKRALRQSSTGASPWLVVAGRNRRYRELAVGGAILEALERAVKHRPSAAPPPVPHAPPDVDGLTILDTVDLTKSLEKKEYDRALAREQGRLAKMARSAEFAKRSLVVAFEGQDAAGKGGAIRRVTHALDPRQYHVVPIAAPTDEERAQPYLWRFWRHLPRRGNVLIFDRSWYGRVLVERVEGFATDQEWQRAYGEINDFEEQIVEHGGVLVKVWLQIDQEEQLRRFRAREEIGFKKFKITEEDWRNREQWDAYRVAVADMVRHTSTEIAPWNLVGANDKLKARVRVLEVINEALERAL